MASGGKVEIQVELEGGGKVQGALNKIGRGAEVAGGKAAQVGEALSASSNVMTASLGNVVSTVGTLTEGIGGLSTASKTAGTSFTAMLGPIAAIGTAVFAVVQAVRQYIRNSQDLETRMEALRAAASEYTGVMERLSDENIVLTKAERRRLAQLTRVAKAQAEYIQKIREGEGVEGQRLQRAQKAFAVAQAEVDMIRKRTHTEAYFLEQSVRARARLRVATMSLEEAEAKLDEREKEAMRNRRALADFQEKIIEQRGRAALQKQQEATAKATQEAATALQSIQNMQLRFNIEAITATGASVSERVAILRVELAERKRLIGQSIADEQERLTAIAAAEQAFSAKRRALYKQDRSQREAVRAQEVAAEQAAADRAFADEQKRRQALIMLQTEGAERERQLIKLRFESATRGANETQLATAKINQHRELMALEQKQEADRRAAEMQRIDALQRSIELTRQEAQALQELSSVDMTKITSAVENFGQGLVFASLAALQSGESVSVAVGEALKAIALQAGVEAIMETARGTAQLFTPGGQAAAAGHFKAAAFFGAAAVAAGSAGSALSASGGGGGAGASPTGAAQSIRDRDLDRDEERGGVTINVNMGQAVIYDTKAAERAFADRVVQAINTPRRGAVRLRGA